MNPPGLFAGGLQPDQLSRYRLRRSTRDDHFCTSEVAALCLELADAPQAAQVLDAYLDVFTHHYLQAKHQLPPEHDGAAHQRLRSLRAAAGGGGWRVGDCAAKAECSDESTSPPAVPR